MTRPPWEDTWLGMALLLAERSTCPRAKVGAVIVIGNEVVSMGYNGAPSGLPHCDEAGCVVDPSTGSCVRAVHAEVNAIWRAGGRSRLATMFTTYSPCYRCAQAIVASGIQTVVYLRDYQERDPRLDPQQLLRDAGVVVVQYADGGLVVT